MWTKSQKISACVLAVALVALGMDRFVLGPPEATGSAAASSEYALSRTASAPAKSSRVEPSQSAAAAAVDTSGVTLASRLTTIGEERRLTTGTCGDAFRPADAWLAALLPPPKPVSPAAVAAQPATRPAARHVDYAALFTKQHTLTAVMKKQSGGMAIIDGKLYSAGQTLDGFKLVRVGLNEATFSGKRTTVVLHMAQPSVADAR